MFWEMKKLFCIFAILTVVLPALAEGEQQQPLDKTKIVATASYVSGAYNTINISKQDKLTSTNVVGSGTGVVVTGVTANNGTVTVEKGEVKVPVGSVNNPSSHVAIWFQ